MNFQYFGTKQFFMFKTSSLLINFCLCVYLYWANIKETHKSCVCFQHAKHDQTLYQIRKNVLVVFLKDLSKGYLKSTPVFSETT